MQNEIKKLIEKYVKFILFIILLDVFNKGREIKIDNLINEQLYRENLDFSKFTTKYKILAIYYPQYYINALDFINKKTTKYIIKKDEIINLRKLLIKKQVTLAKMHGIYGFGIVYDVLNSIKFNEDIFDLFTSNNMLNFPFCIIINSDSKHYQQNKNSLIQNSEYEKEELNILSDSISKYFLSENYIKLTGKPILGVFQSSFSFKLICYFRKHDVDKKNPKIYIISISFGNKNLKLKKKINSFVEFPIKSTYIHDNLAQQYFYNFYYPNLFQKSNYSSKIIRNFFIINGCKPEKFYLIFKKYLNLNKSGKNVLLLFNAWNNHKENSFLEPSEEFGFSYLNYFSKAIFNLDNNIVYNFQALKNKCKVAIQIHLFYKDLINDIINKTNNIPVKCDMFITITSQQKVNILEKYIKKFSKANHFEIMIVENKGRDVIPFLNQIKNKFKYYKYLCHIHTKKSLKAPEIGDLWRNYLYNNLLGSVKIVSEILYDFEKHKKLGFIFPETFYGIIQHFYILTEETKKWMEILAEQLFPNYSIGELLNFPAGNMFWAKIKAISQIFFFDYSEYTPKEDDQTNDTIMHAIERIWLYLVKSNNFSYKTIFNIF